MTCRLAIDLERNAEHCLEGPCPSCGQSVTITVDTLYTCFNGHCPSCQQPLAYHTPPGTYRTDPPEPTPGVRPIDRHQYCCRCRQKITHCPRDPACDIPKDYQQTSTTPWCRSTSPVPE